MDNEKEIFVSVLLVLYFKLKMLLKIAIQPKLNQSVDEQAIKINPLRADICPHIDRNIYSVNQNKKKILCLLSYFSA